MHNKVLQILDTIFGGSPRFSVWRTIYLNFRTLPLRKAIRFPLRVYGKISLACLDGEIILPDNSIIRIGRNYAAYRKVYPGRISLGKGARLIIHKDVLISQGANILVNLDATLELKRNSTVGDGAEIICYRHVILGEHTGLTWQCQLMDYNSHFIQQPDGSIPSIYKDVIIGNYCWIGNRTTIMPGTHLPDSTIVASNSLLNKNYVNLIEPYSLIAGQPAKVVRTNIRRIYDSDLEKALNYHYRKTDSCYNTNA